MTGLNLKSEVNSVGGILRIAEYFFTKDPRMVFVVII